MNKQEFLVAYNVTEADLENAQIEWSELARIGNEYEKIEGHLRDIGKEFVNDYLYDIDTAGIHSYRYRTKKSGHLMEKIIRKRKENLEKFEDLDHTNYYKYCKYD